MVVAFSLWWIWISGWASPGVILVILGFSSIASGINIAAWQSFIPQLVAPTDMLPAVRVNSMQFVASRAFGPALAGWILAEYGAGTAFFLNACSFVLVIVALLIIRPRSVVRDRDFGTVREHFREALRYIKARPALSVPIPPLLPLDNQLLCHPPSGGHVSRSHVVEPLVLFLGYIFTFIDFSSHTATFVKI